MNQGRSNPEPRGCIHSFFLGVWLGLMYNLARRPGPTLGCSCLGSSILLLLVASFLLAYPVQTILVVGVGAGIFVSLKAFAASRARRSL